MKDKLKKIIFKLRPRVVYNYTLLTNLEKGMKIIQGFITAPQIKNDSEAKILREHIEKSNPNTTLIVLNKV